MSNQYRSSKLIKTLISELSTERDPQLALRKALLALILFNQGSQNGPMNDFLFFLLVNFSPLTGHFKDHKHPFIAGEELMRARDQKDNPVLLGREQFWQHFGLDDLN